MDAKLKKVIEFIKDNGVSRGDDWEKQISDVEPDWEEVMTCRDNWKELEGVCRRSDYLKLCLYEHRDKGRSPYFNEIIENIKPEEWNFHSKEVKELMISYLFESKPGEPFETIRKSYHIGKGIGAALMVPFYGYIPSHEIIHLRQIIQESGDEESLKVLDDQIKERERICKPPKNISIVDQKSRYNPDPFERELISDLLWIFKKEGFSIIPLPPIFLSCETPPLFLLYPRLSQDSEGMQNRPREKRGNSNIREEGYPETFGIEQLLGCYRPNPGIILYVLGINWLSKQMSFDLKFLRSVVLIHEISHWIMHMLPGPTAPKWDTELYNLSETELHETWAQLLTYWVSDFCGKSSEFAETFRKLCTRQPSEYKLFNEFVNINKSTVISSLAIMRRMKTPGTLKDFETLTR